jgi:hypothetical protein
VGGARATVLKAPIYNLYLTDAMVVRYGSGSIQMVYGGGAMVTVITNIAKVEIVI